MCRCALREFCGEFPSKFIILFVKSFGDLFTFSRSIYVQNQSAVQFLTLERQNPSEIAESHSFPIHRASHLARELVAPRASGLLDYSWVALIVTLFHTFATNVRYLIDRNKIGQEQRRIHTHREFFLRAFRTFRRRRRFRGSRRPMTNNSRNRPDQEATILFE